MSRKIILTKEIIDNLKFEDCISCKHILSKMCNGCDSGENFRERLNVKDTFSFMQTEK